MGILYLSIRDIKKTGILDDDYLPNVWEMVQASLTLLGSGKAEAPLDMYLRPKKQGYVDRIIAKTSFVDLKEVTGTEVAGLKWIASAPSNVTKGIPRANGIIVLNDPYTGQVMTIMDAAPINALRTAAVSISALRNLQPSFKKLVIFGAGIIGNEHLRQTLTASNLGLFPRLTEINVFDTQKIKSVQLVEKYHEAAEKRDIKLGIAGSLKECFTNETAVIIATNALNPYLDSDTIEGKQGLVVVHVSLRDYYPKALACFDLIVVDSWEHIVREGTSVELAYNTGLINRTRCLELIKIFAERVDINNEGNIIINPMGISVTDLAIGLLVYRSAKEKGIGVRLE